MRRLVPLAAAVCMMLALVGCESTPGSGDELQLVQNPKAAKPAKSPRPSVKPEGTVYPVNGEVTALAIEPESGVLGVALMRGARPQVLLYGSSELKGKPEAFRARGRVERLDHGGARGLFAGAVPSADGIAYFNPDSGEGEAFRPVSGGPAGSVRDDLHLLVALREGKAVEVFGDHEGERSTITGEMASADQILLAGGNVVVLDRVRSALFEIDVEDGDVGLGLRAGQGATNAVTDKYDRVLVTDTRGGGLLAFSTGPLLLRQRYPVPGSPYGIAYDERRDLAWVTLTARNEVVGYDVGGGEPVEKYRYATVQQPNTVTVDARSGRLVVGSGTGDGLQVIEP